MRYGEPEMAKETVVQSINQPVNRDRLPSLPSRFHHGGLTHVHRLLDDVEFAQSIDRLLRPER